MPKPQGLDQVSAQFEMKCPFCQFHDRSSYILLLHIEEMHPDGSASVIPKGNGPIPEPANDPGLDMASSAQSPEYIICDVEDCGEPILMTELDSHMDLHYAEQVALKDFESAGGSEGSRTPKSSSKSKRARKDSHSSPSRRGLFGSSSSSSSSTKKRRSSKSPYAANGKSSSSRTSSKSKEDRLGVCLFAPLQSLVLTNSLEIRSWTLCRRRPNAFKAPPKARGRRENYLEKQNWTRWPYFQSPMHRK